MPSTVLGKRQRCFEEGDELPTQHINKRRTRSSRLQLATATPVILQQDEPTESCTPDRVTVKKASASKNKSNRTARDKTRVQPAAPAAIEQDENAPPADLLETPQTTSRFRDALKASTPSTPKHRVQLVNKAVTPRTPRTPTTSAATSIYSSARALFSRSTNSGRLIGRERERDELRSYIRRGCDARKGGCLYVSGPPGTGKSSLVDEVCEGFAEEKSVIFAKVNCASMVNSKDVYGKLVEDLCDENASGMSEEKQLESLFVPSQNAKGPVYVITLDEMDHLLTSDLEVLYTIFEWSLQSNSRLILIGIANALDLTDRFLPRLKAKNLKPQLLPFIPYSAAQIASVISKRLQSLLDPSEVTDKNFVPFLHPAAIQLCAKKVATQTGDVRKAFDIARKAIDMIAIETQRKQEQQRLLATPTKAPLSDNTNLATTMTPPSTPKKNETPILTAVTAPRATIAHVARIATAAFGNGTAQRLQNLNLHQKAALCVLVATDRRRKDILATPSKVPNKASTIKHVYDNYAEACKRDNLVQPLSATEFRDVIGSLETLGLIGEGQKAGIMPSSAARGVSAKVSALAMDRAADDKRIVCFVAEKEVEGCVGSTGAGEGILRSLLYDA